QTSVQPDDALQEGAIAIMRAIAAFNPDRGVRFTTFAGLLIRNAVCDLVRRDAKASHERYGVQAVEVEVAGPLAEELARPRPIASDLSDAELSLFLIDLPLPQRRLIEMLYGLNG